MSHTYQSASVVSGVVQRNAKGLRAIAISWHFYSLSLSLSVAQSVYLYF